MARDRRAPKIKRSSMLGSADHSGTVISRCDEELKNSIPRKRGHKAKLNTGVGMKRNRRDSESITHSCRQLNRKESNTIPIIKECGAGGISHTGCRIIIHTGVIVNMRIGLMYIRKHDKRKHTISRYRKGKSKGGRWDRGATDISDLE